MRRTTKRTSAALCGAVFLATGSLASPALAAFPDEDVAPIANDDLCATDEDVAVNLAVVGNDVDPDSTPTVVEIDGQPVSIGDTVSLASSGGPGGTVTVNADGTLTYTPGVDSSGATSFTYAVSDMVASGSAGVSYHLESSTDNGPLLFMIDLTSGAKTFIGMFPTGGSTAMAFDESSGFLYVIRANGDLYAYDPSTPIATTVLVGNIESATSGWTTPVPSAYSQQTGTFYNGSLYLVPTARPTPTLDDALYRVDFINPTTITDVTKVADMSGDTVEWNNNDDIAIDDSTGILYGRSDTNDQTTSQRSSYFYAYDLNTGAWNMIIDDIGYAYDYVTPANNPASRNDFRDASIGLTASNGRVFGTQGAGTIGELDPATGAWTVLSSFVPDDGDLGVGGDLAHHGEYLRTSSATVDCTVTALNDPPDAVNDNATTPAGTAVTIDPIGGDGSDSDVDGTVDPTSVTLVPPAGAVVGGDGSVAVEGVGVWEVNGTSGLVTFTPEAGFSGTAVIDYTIADDTGLVSAPATIAVVVAAQTTTSTSTSTTSTTAQATTTASTTQTTTAAATPRALAFTGSEPSIYAAFAGILVAAGSILMLISRRRPEVSD